MKPKPNQPKRRKYPCVVVKKSEWDKMPKKTRAAMIEMCQTAADQVGSVQRRNLPAVPESFKQAMKECGDYVKLQKLAKAIVDDVFDGASIPKVLIGKDYKRVVDRIERLLKEHGI